MSLPEVQQQKGHFTYNQNKADQIDREEAAKLLKALRHEGEAISLQTFNDGPDELYELKPNKRGEERPRWNMDNRSAWAAQQYSCQIEDLQKKAFYVHANLARCGVYFCVNILEKGKTRNADNVQRVAAIFIDLDGSPLPVDGFPLEPTAIVESSPERWHVYWAVDGVPPEEFEHIQKHLAALYKSDPYVHDLARVMRLPGYWHGKQEEGFLTRIADLNAENQYTHADLIQAWPNIQEALDQAEEEKKQLLEKAKKRREEAKKLLEEKGEKLTGTAEDRWAQSALLGCCADLMEATPESKKRNITLNAVSYRMGRIIGAGLIDENHVRAEFEAISLQNGLPHNEIQQVLDDALTDGKAKPVDTSTIGTKVKKKEPKPNKQLAIKAQQQAQNEQVNASDIPNPTGENGTYSDDQILHFLGLSEWPVMSAISDKTHAFRLQKIAADDLAYCPELKGWLAWQSPRWRKSKSKGGEGALAAQQKAAQIGIKVMQPECKILLTLFGVLNKEVIKLEAASETEQVGIAKWRAKAMERAYFAHHKAAQFTEQMKTQRNVLESAAPLFKKDIELFQPRPWILGFQNGTWDRGEFRESRRQDYLLNIADIEYDPNADKSVWYELLERMTNGDRDLARTLQDIAGYALSGASSHRLLPWCYGAKGTGKSTFSELLITVLGELSATIDTKKFGPDMARDRLGFDMWGRRIVVCAEAGSKRLDPELLKTLSGSDRLPARELYAEAFTYSPNHVLMMVSNDPPQVTAYDDALKDRVLALPFKQPLQEGGPLKGLGKTRIEAARQDPSHPLVKGFAAWAIEGLNRFYRTGEIHKAAACIRATQAFWDDVDPLTDFWESLEPDELKEGVPALALREQYESWCEAEGARALGRNKFTQACEAVGLERIKESVYDNGKRERVTCWKLTLGGWHRFGNGDFENGASNSSEKKTVLDSEKRHSDLSENTTGTVFDPISQKSPAREEYSYQLGKKVENSTQNGASKKDSAWSKEIKVIPEGKK